jgi:hypothetical protein
VNVRFDRDYIMVALAALALGATAGCKKESGSIRERDADERRRAGTFILADTAVVAQMRSPAEPSRIIYAPPVDLSYANAQRMRPDLVRPDTTRKADTSRARTRRDTTAGDASADTSGGAARPRP